MTVDQIAIIVLVLLFAIGLSLRNWFKNRQKKLLISRQYLAGKILSVIEHNPEKPEALIEISLKGQKLSSERFGIEFISRKRDLVQYYFHGLELINKADDKNSEDNQSVFLLDKKSFLFAIKNLEIKLYRFRFFIKLEENSLLKTPELAFSSKTLLFKPDTGKYN